MEVWLKLVNNFDDYDGGAGGGGDDGELLNYIQQIVTCPVAMHSCFRGL